MPARSPKSRDAKRQAAERARRYRERKAAGQRCLTIDLDQDLHGRLIALMVELNLIEAEGPHAPADLSLALSMLLETLIQNFPRHA